MRQHTFSCCFAFCIISFLLVGCGQTQNKDGSGVTSNSPNYNNSDVQSVLGILYQQQAAEYRALCYQSYNIAKLRIDEALKCKKAHKPFAIITDLDETALDNSAESSWLILHDSTPSSGDFYRHWWVDGLSGTWSGAMPGSVDFFNYVHSKGVIIYYITNRDSTDSVITATMGVMHALKFPQTDTATDKKYFLFKAKNAPNSSKESRRLYVEKNDSVIVLLGDNLIDLNSCFDGQPMNIRRKNADSLKDRWGDRYIVFPNAVYGDWESALYKSYTYPATIQAKDSIRIITLDTTNNKH